MSIIAIGDVHRKWNYLSTLIYNFPENTTFIQTGDFGIGFARLEDDLRDLKSLSENLNNNKSRMFVIRGNHDNPQYFTEEEIIDNIFLLKDYSRIIIEDKNILCIGGATSVDRSIRTFDKNKWKDEEFNYTPELIGKEKLDIIITHSGPEPLRPVGFSNIRGWLEVDLDLNRDLLHENRDFDTLDQILTNRPEYWICGHFHPSSKRSFCNETHYIQLNELEFYELK